MTERGARPLTPVQLPLSPPPGLSYETLSPILPRRLQPPTGDPRMAPASINEIFAEAQTFIDTAMETGVDLDVGHNLLERLKQVESVDEGFGVSEARELRDSIERILMLSFDNVDEEGDDDEDSPESAASDGCMMASMSTSVPVDSLTCPEGNTRDVLSTFGTEVHLLRDSEAQRNVGKMLDASGMIKAEDVKRGKPHSKHGAFGSIFEGTFRGTAVMIKELDDQTEDAVYLFKREVTMLNKARGSYTCELLGWCPKPLMFVMTRYTRVLEDALRKSNLLSLDERVRVLYQIGVGLVNVHSVFIIHNDLKLTNVFLDEHNNVRIGDFGKACFVGSEDLRDLNNRGNLMHRSPEDLRGELPTLKSDVYSFGLLAYEILIGDPYFRARYNGREREFIEFVTTPECNVLPDVYLTPMRNDDDTNALSKEFWSAVSKCWSYDPEDRPTMREVVEAIYKYGVKSAIPRSEKAENFWHTCCDYTYKDRVDVAQVARNATFVPSVNIGHVLGAVCNYRGFITIREFWQLCCWFPNWFEDEEVQVDMKESFEQGWFELTKESGKRRLMDAHGDSFFVIFPNVKDAFTHPFTVYRSIQGKRTQFQVARHKSTLTDTDGFVLTCGLMSGEFDSLIALANCILTRRNYRVPPSLDDSYAGE